MGTASTTKFLVNANGASAEQAALTTSAGAADAQKIPALNAGGVLDPTLLNAKNASAGAGDAGKVPLLNAQGQFDQTFMPPGVAADVGLIVASEALAAGDLVNIYSNVGAANCRKADGSTTGKEANGFVLAAVGAAATATVYFEGLNNQCTGLTPGTQFLSGATPGKSVPVGSIPTGAGKINQVVGFAYSTTAMNFSYNPPITLA